MFKINFVLTLGVSTLLFLACSKTPPAKEVNIIPKPVKTEINPGEFTITPKTTIGFNEPTLKAAAEYLQQLLATTGYELAIAEGEGNINLHLTADKEKEGAYSFVSTPKSVNITSSSYGGIISGISTFRQLLPVEIEKHTSGRTQWSIPAVAISDTPRFAWRGMMLDVARHFYNKEEVKKFLDLMALYKLNKFHWHLSDDQGWRVEIKKYPLLTEKGAWRTYNSHDKSCLSLAKKQDNTDFLLPAEKQKVVNGDTLYGGFYTQEDIKEVIAYAAQRGIDIIPEIDMPGHFLTAIHCYPEIACSGLIGWGETFSSPICPGKDATLEFCKNVYQEIFELFPYEYIHLGADEVEKANWKKCADCQKRMKANNLKTEEELQSWFVKDMEKFLNDNGKHMIGWDEIIEGGLSETATVMWWRSWHPQSVPTATGQGNKVIASPNAHLYFDAQPDKKTFKNVFDLDPILPELTPEQGALVIGVQANTWTEWIPSIERVEYLIAPRILALSEIAWVEPETKNWDEFIHRAAAQFPRLDAMDINYRIPDLEGFYDNNVFTDEAVVNVTCMLPGTEIRYTTDGTIPTKSSSLYTEPIRVSETTDFTFRTFRPNGTAGDFVKTSYIKESYAEADSNAEVKTKGLKAVWHNYRGDDCKGIETAPIKGEYVVEEVGIPTEVKGNIGLVLSGYIDIPEDGIYTFTLLSDDGSILTIDGNVVIDNDGPHPPKELIGQKALKKGLHPVKMHYFDYNGGVLKMKVTDPTGKVLENYLKH